tara:strand:+ start:1565 stop:2524 length:960 start_codon:yes stop_codon:yes gene_type:complete
MSKKILITGGSGLVGRHMQDILPEAVYISSTDYDLTNLDAVHTMMETHIPDTVIHLAARVGGLLDNMKYQVEYLEENIQMNTNILNKCHEFNVDRVITTLSTCIYPDKVDIYPMREDDLFSGPPPPSNFNYAMAKRCMAAHIDSYVSQYSKKWCYLIPCNLYGEYDKYSEHNSHFVAALIKKIHDATDNITLWGTGKPLRQYMYGGDLARIIKYMIDNDITENFNVAPPYVYSINEMAKIALKAINKNNFNINYDTSKPDGQFRKDVDTSKLLNIIGDFDFTSLEAGIKLTYNKIKNKQMLFIENPKLYKDYEKESKNN